MKTVATNGHDIKVVGVTQVPYDVLCSRFRHLSLQQLGMALYFEYRGKWYTTYDVYPINPDSEFARDWQFSMQTPEGDMVLRIRRYCNSPEISSLVVGRVKRKKDAEQYED